MSIFDPQQLYYHRVRSTRKGQVIQQKPIKHEGAYDSDEIPRSISLLEVYGYHVIPRSTPIYFSQLDTRSFTWTKELGNLQLTDLFPLPIQFSQIWDDPNIKSFYQTVYNIDPLSVIALNFEIYVQSVQIYGTLQLSNPQVNGDNPGFNIPNTEVILDPATTGGNVVLAANSVESNFSIFSYSSTNVLCMSSYERTDGRTVRDITMPSKQGIDNSPAIYHLEYHQPAVLTALKNSDYQAFNPHLININWLGNENSLPFSASNSLISVTINLEVVHK